MTLRPLACALAFGLIAGLAAMPSADAAKKKRAAPKAAAAPSACSDFYASANAAWLKANPLPAGTASVSALEQLGAQVRRQQFELLDTAMNAPQNNVQKLLGDFWASGLDEAAVERDGAQPIAPLLGRIDAIRKAKDVPPAIAALHQVGIPVAFNFSADIDLDDLDRHIGYFAQGGLGLPDPAYYTRDDADTRALMARYTEYVQKILALTGTPQARLADDAKRVIDLETRIARASKGLLDLRDPRANYAPVATASLAKRYKRLQLAEFLKAQGVSDDTVSMANPQLFATLDGLVGSLKPAQWQAYLRWRVGDAMAPYLAKPFRDAHFDFRGRVLQGLGAPPERRQAVLDAITLAAGPMLGREYAARYLPAATDRRAEEIAVQVRDALGAALERDARLSPAAKAEAQAKLAKLAIEVGTPRRDLDYSVQPMGRGSFGSNMLIASTWRHREEMKRIGRGNADRRWDVLPQEPALAYDIAQNRLIVTAAMLQPPVLDTGKSAAWQYGTFGALVGHELSHGFDNRGRMVDAKQQLRDWWTPAEVAAWNGVADRIAAAYAGFDYPGLKGAKVNGPQVRDEAVADLAGVELAWAAYRKLQPAPARNADQDFYKGWASLWPQQLSEEAARQRAATSVHAPGQWRTNGPLLNMAGFGEAFGCKAGNAMQAKEPVVLFP
ncbi:M13 family metallopeptidase [Vulcaniibacterium tengchongense]|uniref:Putative endopeptidase n=1 Tax=Vulcaniibacterium tengchongense TaxID=1273429 RepID=A0A3N4VQ19_9GAMM|nr:M13 family metallopeptidase [Vulcaniibacterium tengchongense]RPE81301.1 putative endopeptidase [Vulcaniibacterium tengchongense]